MERKLFLSEDLGEDIVMDDGKVVADENSMLTNLITLTIKGEWDAVELYNNMIASIDDEATIEVLSEIVREEYVHIGQLEKLLQDKNDASLGIEDGKDHDHEEDDLDDVQVPEEDIEVETEGLTEGLLDVPNLDITYSHGATPEAKMKETIIVGLYTNAKQPPDKYHYEIDPYMLVYTKVKPNRLLSQFRYTTAPFDWMEDVDEYAKSVIDQYEGIKEISPEEFEQIQRDKWSMGAIMPEEPGGKITWKH